MCLAKLGYMLDKFCLEGDLSYGMQTCVKVQPLPNSLVPFNVGNERLLSTTIIIVSKALDHDLQFFFFVVYIFNRMIKIEM